MQDIGDTDLMELHALVTPYEILKVLEKHRERYIGTLDDVKKIYGARKERYREADKEYTQKEIDGELTEAEKRAKPKEPQMPPDRTKTYDRYIALYKATQAEKVYLAEQHFMQFFLDEWDFIRAHISHLRMMRAGGTGTFLSEELSSVAANALVAYRS